jgi:hypothetical protein
MVRNDELLNELHGQSTVRLVLLCILTLGIYAAHYIKRQSAILNRYVADQKVIPGWFVHTAMYLAYITALLVIPYILLEEGHPIAQISDKLDILLSICFVIWGFYARNKMNSLLRSSRDDASWFSGFWALLFTPFYFNYKVNVLHRGSLSKTPG